MTRIKICGLTRHEDAVLAASLADEVGFVLEPSSPRFVLDIESLSIDPSWNATTFAVFGPLPSSPLPSQLQRVQFIPDWGGPVPQEMSSRFRPVLRPTSETDWAAVKAWLDEAESTELVLDPFHKDAFGGTGLRLDDSAIERAQQEVGIPLVIAGGLNQANVAAVIKQHQPWGVDVSSGTESQPGIKDPNKVRAFVEAVRSA